MYNLKKLSTPTILTEESIPIIAFNILFEDKSIGYLEMNMVRYDPKLYIREILISPEYRGKGHAKNIIDILKAICFDQKINKLELEPTNDSCKFWEHLGFKKVKGKNMAILF